MLRLARVAALAAVVAAPPPHSSRQQDDRGRPVILMLHGRGMLDRDTVELRKQWLNGLQAGARSVGNERLVAERDVRLVWYADVLDPWSGERCDYDAGDPRARRDAASASDFRSFASLLGNILGVFTSVVADSGAGVQLRSIASDATFLGDSHKRCASERRLGDALDRAKREGRPVILVAHSLGSLVAYDYLSSRKDTGLVQRLVSVGSPLGSTGLRELLIGGDSTDSLSLPPSVKAWVNVRNDGDAFAAPLSIGRDILTTPSRSEPDYHEMVGYLRNPVVARAVLTGWCAAFASGRPAACADIKEPVS